VYTTLRGAVNRRGLAAAVWLTRTHCLGVCPRSGTAVALAPGGQLLTEVGASDAEALLAAVTARPRPAGGP
jgi:(2Fe-2S) ferredoxin